MSNQNETAATAVDNKNKNRAAPAATATKKADKEDTFIYIGPSIPAAMLKHNAILRGTLQEIQVHYADAFALCPAISKLFVPLAKLATCRKEASTGGTHLHKCCADVVAALTQKKEG
jgi:hypothetical protein